MKEIYIASTAFLQRNAIATAILNTKKTHKIMPRNCCFGVITLCSPKKNYYFLSIFHCAIVHWKVRPSFNLSTNEGSVLQFDFNLVLSLVERLSEGCAVLRSYDESKLDGFGFSVCV